jgi:hypothetical protein
MSARVTISVTGCSTWNARVHLHEIESTVLIEEKLTRARARITELLARSDRRVAHRLALLRRQHDRTAPLPSTSGATLNRALTLAEMDALAKLIRQHLDLDVSRLLDVLLDVDTAVIERRGSFG